MLNKAMLWDRQTSKFYRMTYGAEIFTRSLSIATRGALPKGYAHGNSWQYHPRSDRHSKILCWAVFFDLLLLNGLLRRHVDADKVSFGINHKMRDFKHDREKDLDLVICRRAESQPTAGMSTFQDMVKSYSIDLTAAEIRILNGLPKIPITTVQTALVAMEAKAAFTEFGKARPRLYDELNSSHLTIHGDTDSVIAAGLAAVNLAGSFVSPSRNGWPLGSQATITNKHKQPKDAASAIEKIKQLPRRSAIGDRGFDAFGILVVECENNGAPVTLAKTPPAPPRQDIFHYDSFIERLDTLYSQRFNGI